MLKTIITRNLKNIKYNKTFSTINNVQNNKKLNKNKVLLCSTLLIGSSIMYGILIHDDYIYKTHCKQCNKRTYYKYIHCIKCNECCEHVDTDFITKPLCYKCILNLNK